MGRLCPGYFRFEFEFATFEGFVGCLHGSAQTIDFLGPLRDLPGSGLEELSVVLELARSSLVLGLVLRRQQLRGFLGFLFGLVRGALSLFDLLERLFGLEHSLRGQPGRFLCLRLSGFELRLAAREGRLPIREGLRSPVEFRPLRPQVRLFLGEFAGLARPLPEFVHFIFQTGDSVLFLVDGVLCLREFRGQRSLSVLAFAPGGLRLSPCRLEVAEHLREVLPRVLEVLLEFRRALVRMIS